MEYSKSKIIDYIIGLDNFDKKLTKIFSEKYLKKYQSIKLTKIYSK